VLKMMCVLAQGGAADRRTALPAALHGHFKVLAPS
jgi:hypothetical protein